MEERNTRITYLYRDADNYKTLNEVVVQGTFTDDEIDEIMGICDQGEYFIPRQVGLPEERFEKLDPQSDHCWFEIAREDFEETSDPWTEPVTAREILAAFRRIRDTGWDDQDTGWMDGYDFYGDEEEEEDFDNEEKEE